LLVLKRYQTSTSLKSSFFGLNVIGQVRLGDGDGGSFLILESGVIGAGSDSIVCCD
jgi:hypothetical protein